MDIDKSSSISQPNLVHPYMSLCAEYENDILDTLKERESWRWKLQFISPQIKHRPSVVELIREIGEEHSYRRTSVHLAIHLLDLFMSNHFIVEERLNLVALTCFYVACKIEENEPNVPSPKKLCAFIDSSYTPADFIALEVTILNFFSWHITIPTAATFLEYFVMYCLQMDDFITPPEPALNAISFAEFHRQVTDSSLLYLDISLLDPKMNNWRPSLLAAACVAAARCLTPNVRAWNSHLTNITGYDYQQIHVLCSILVFDLSPQSASPLSSSSSNKRTMSDSGYRSDSVDSMDGELNDSIDEGNKSSGTSYSTPCSTSRSSSTFSSSSSIFSSNPEETSAKRQKISYDSV